MALKNFDLIVERAKESFKPLRVVIAGADAENMLLGAFQAQDEGFASPVLVGEPDKVEPMLERLGLKSKPYKLVAIGPEESPAARACGSMMVESCSSRPGTDISIRLSVILPRSILLMSRMSLIRLSRCREETEIFRRQSAPRAGSSM